MANLKKLCSECKWQDYPSSVTPCCMAPQNDEGDPIKGGYGPRWAECRFHRGDGWLYARLNRTCGKEGRWWEERDD